MKVGTDGVLIGAYTKVENAKKILDVGTGTGLIALMLAQKSNAMVFGIDINEEAVKLARFNAEKSLFASRISISHCAFADYQELDIDLIVSNPPYFTTDVLAPDKNRALARHNIELTISELVFNINRLLKPDGRAIVIFPVEQSREFEQESLAAGFYIKSRLVIHPTQTKNPVRIITEISKSKSDTIIESLAIEKTQRHEYTEEYIRLTADYYLKF